MSIYLLVYFIIIKHDSSGNKTYPKTELLSFRLDIILQLRFMMSSNNILSI